MVDPRARGDIASLSSTWGHPRIRGGGIGCWCAAASLTLKTWPTVGVSAPRRGRWRNRCGVAGTRWVIEDAFKGAVAGEGLVPLTVPEVLRPSFCSVAFTPCARKLLRLCPVRHQGINASGESLHRWLVGRSSWLGTGVGFFLPPPEVQHGRSEN